MLPIDKPENSDLKEILFDYYRDLDHDQLVHVVLDSYTDEDLAEFRKELDVLDEEEDES